MVYRTNEGYTNGASYSFSSRQSNYTSNNGSQIEYSKSFGVSYPEGYGKSLNNFNYANKGNNGIGYNIKRGVGSFGNAGGGGIKGMNRGIGGGAGIGKGNGKGSGQGEGIGNKGQMSIDVQNQLIAEQKNNDSLIEIDLAIKNLTLPDLPQNQILSQEVTQLEMGYHKETIIVKKATSKQEHLELIIRKIESVSVSKKHTKK